MSSGLKRDEEYVSDPTVIEIKEEVTNWVVNEEVTDGVVNEEMIDWVVSGEVTHWVHL